MTTNKPLDLVQFDRPKNDLYGWCSKCGLNLTRIEGRDSSHDCNQSEERAELLAECHRQRAEIARLREALRDMVLIAQGSGINEMGPEDAAICRNAQALLREIGEDK